jgi:hypothetical protein
MTSPKLKVDSASWLKYSWSHQYNTSYPNDRLTVLSRIDTVLTWDTLQVLVGPSFNTLNSTATTAGDFKQEILNFPSGYTGNKIFLRFIGNSGFGPDVFIDDVIVEQVPNCLPPSSMSLASLSATSASINFLKGDSSSVTQYEVGFTGFLPGQGLSSVAGSTAGFSFSVSGLTANSTYEVYIRDSCGLASQSSWVGPFSFTTPCLAVGMPFSEDFTTTTWPPTCFTFSTTGSPAQNWSQFNNDMARANFWGWVNGVKALMNTPSVNITQPARLRFYWSHLYSASYPNDALFVIARNDTSGIGDTLLVLNGPTFNTTGAGNTTPATSFTEEIINLPTAYQGGAFSFEFHANSGFGPDVFIDEIFVEQLPACPDPTNFTLTSNTATTASFTFDMANNNAGGFNVEWGPIGFTPASAIGGTASVATGSPFSISNLPPGTCIDVWVQADCGTTNNGSSNWVGPITVCLPKQFDVSLNGLASPGALGCGAANTPVQVIIENQGFDPLPNFPIQVNITGDITQNINFNYTGALAGGLIDTISVGTINGINGGFITLKIGRAHV